MVHFLRAPNRAAAEHLASLLFERQKPLCLSSREMSGEVDMPAWRVETIDCCGEPLSSAKPITLMNWRAPRR